MEDNDKGKAKAWRDAIVKLIHPDMGCFTRDERVELTGSDEAWFGIRKNVV